MTPPGQRDPQIDKSSTKTRKKTIRNRYGKTLAKNYRNWIALDTQNCVFVKEGSQKSRMPLVPKKVPKRDAKGVQKGAFGHKNRERSLSERCSKSVSEKIRALVAMVSKKAPKRHYFFMSLTSLGHLFRLWKPAGPKDANSLDFLRTFTNFS